MTVSRALARSPMGADTRKFAYLELRGLKRDGTFSGYASIFGEVDLGKMPAPETEVRCTPAPSGQAENPRADRGSRRSAISRTSLSGFAKGRLQG